MKYINCFFLIYFFHNFYFLPFFVKLMDSGQTGQPGVNVQPLADTLTSRGLELVTLTLQSPEGTTVQVIVMIAQLARTKIAQV